MSEILWQPTAAAAQKTEMARFTAYVAREYGVRCASYSELHAWSIKSPADFWEALARFADVKFSKPYEAVLAKSDAMYDARWFVGGELNFAEHLLRYSAGEHGERDALVSYTEAGCAARVSFNELAEQVKSIGAALRFLGVKPGDRVAGWLPNQVETVVAALATASIGAVWSACSPDFSAEATCDRFSQIAPKVLFATAQSFYKGKRHDCVEKLREMAESLPSLEHVVVTTYPGLEAGGGGGAKNIGQAALHTWEALVSTDSDGFSFEQMPFDAPLYIMYSSGTTGAPKCIVHGAGGTLLQHLKEHRLHTDIRAGERVFYYTTCGWMMWQWLVSALASGATLVLYDGMPLYPDAAQLWNIAAAERVAVFGTSASYIYELDRADYSPKQHHDLSALRAVLSTGSPLTPSGFVAAYSRIKADMQLASISGGTDIVSCFLLGNPALPVRAGELQCAGLGLDVAIYDDSGARLVGSKGELVCRQPFPSMPIYFWNDSDRAKYRAAYFERYENVWHHGDYAAETADGGFVIYGRSDATLNPGGVRIGTGEIYRALEKVAWVAEALAVSKRHGSDDKIVLFVIAKDAAGGADGAAALSEERQNELRRTIRAEASPRHVPWRIFAVDDFPRTLSGKVSELTVRALIGGDTPTNLASIANPDCLAQFGALDFG